MSSRSDTLAIVRRALRCPHGWRKAGTDSRGHHLLMLPDGRRAAYSLSPSGVHAGRNLATQLGALCGCDFWPPWRKPSDMSGFDIDRAARETVHRQQVRAAHAEERRAMIDQVQAAAARDREIRALMRPGRGHEG